MAFLDPIRERLPLPLEKLHDDLLRRALPFLQSRLKIRRITGRTTNGREHSLLLVGDQLSARNLVRRFFPTLTSSQNLGTIPLRDVHSRLEALAGTNELVLSVVPKACLRKVITDTVIFVPEWVDYVSTRDSDGFFQIPNTDAVKSDLRRIRRNHLKARVTHDPKDLQVFLHSMYRPYMKKRFGEQDLNIQSTTISRRFRHGGLHFIETPEKTIAGEVFYLYNNTLFFFVVGILDGSFSYVQQGALAALYYYAFQLGERLGVGTINFGGCTPVLADSILWYKNKWNGAIAHREVFYEFVVTWKFMNDTVRSFFDSCPLLFRDQGGFAGLWTPLPENLDDSQALRRKLRKIFVPGVDRFYVGVPEDFEPAFDLPVGASLIPLSDVNPQFLNACPS